MAQIETLGDAFTYGVRIHVSCAWGPQTMGYKRGRECSWNYELDGLTLIATRGRAFPLARLAERLRCPRCGSRRVRVFYTFPSLTEVDRQAARLTVNGQA